MGLPLRPHRVLVSLLALLLAAVPSPAAVGGLVLCVAADGCAQLEESHGSHPCAASDPCGAERRPGLGGDTAEGCRDFAVSASAGITSERRAPDAPYPTGRGAPCTAAAGALPAVRPATDAPRPDAGLHARRTVVLRH